MALKPLTHPDDLYQLLREGKVKEFNQRKAQADRVKINDCDFRHLDLRGMDSRALISATVIFAHRFARHRSFPSTLEGASLNGARISGVLFPAELGAARDHPVDQPRHPCCATGNSAIRETQPFPLIIDELTPATVPALVHTRAGFARCAFAMQRGRHLSIRAHSAHT